MSGLWSVALKSALDAFSAIGLDAGRICADAGIRSEWLRDPDRRIPLELTGKIWPAAAAQWGRTGLGLAAGSAQAFGKFEALDYALATADTVGEGLERVSRYYAVVTGGATGIELLPPRAGRPPRVVLRGYGLPDLRDYALSALVIRLRTAGAAPRRVTVAGHPMAPRREYEAKLGCPVELNEEESAIELAPDALKARLPKQYPGLRTVVDREIARLLANARANEDPLADVRREVTTLLGPTAPTLELVADRLGLSSRQLQRRLVKHGSSFKDVVAQSRHALAELYLRQGTLAVGEIAYLLGYSEPSAFSRAFKRWTGKAPEQLRRNVP